MINADKPHLWKEDIAASVDLFNEWFMRFAPKAYRETRVETTKQVEEDLRATSDMQQCTATAIRSRPQIVPTLRMCTAPPIARDRLIGLAEVRGSLVHRLEDGKLPTRVAEGELEKELKRICSVVDKLLDRDIFPWLARGDSPSEQERWRAATIVADRLCGAVADPIVRNAQEKRQLASIGGYLEKRGYRAKSHSASAPIEEMEAGTFCTRLNVKVGKQLSVRLPIDVVIQPKRPRKSQVPVFIEAKSAGDFTNTNKRRKEEATKIHQLRERFGEDGQLVLFLCGYFNAGYLGYEAAEGIDWVWEHRIEDLSKLGI